MFRNIESFPAGKAIPIDRVLAAVPFDANGLIAAIAQQFDSGEVLMPAWMNRQALEETLTSGRASHTGRRSCFYKPDRQRETARPQQSAAPRRR